MVLRLDSIVVLVDDKVKEALSRMMTTTMDRGLLFGFLVGLRNNEELLVSHLLFVDDTLIFCEASFEQL
jgi:hypothetical protein